MATGAIIGGLAAAAGTVAGSAISSGVSVRNTNRANSLNAAMQQKMLDYNTRATDPSYIRQRQEAAGYNAALLASPNSLGQAANAPNPAPAQIPDTSALNGVGAGIAQAVNLAIQAKRTSAQNKYDVARTQQVYIEQQYQATEAMARINNILENTKSQRARRQLDEILQRFQDRIYENQLQMSNVQIQQIKEQTRGQVMENVMTSVRLRSFPELIRLDIANSAANLAVQKQVERLTAKQVDVKAQEIAESIVRTGLYQEQMNTQQQVTRSARAQADVSSRTVDYNVRLIKEELIKTISEQKIPKTPAQMWGFARHQNYDGL